MTDPRLYCFGISGCIKSSVIFLPTERLAAEEAERLAREAAEKEAAAAEAAAAAAEAGEGGEEGEKTTDPPAEPPAGKIYRSH